MQNDLIPKIFSISLWGDVGWVFLKHCDCDGLIRILMESRPFTFIHIKAPLAVYLSALYGTTMARCLCFLVYCLKSMEGTKELINICEQRSKSFKARFDVGAGIPSGVPV